MVRFQTQDDATAAQVKRYVKWGAIGILILILIPLFFRSFTIVQAGEVCVEKHFGKAENVANAGFQIHNPIGTKFACYSSISTIYEGVEGNPKESDSKADYVDWAIDAVTVDGQQVYITFSVRYKIDASQVVTIHTDVARTMDSVNERVVKFHTRTVVRDVVNRSTADTLYSGGLGPINDTITKELAPLFTESNVILEHFEIKKPFFSDEYTTAIENKQLAIERAEQAENEVLVAEQEAERQRTTAEGERDAEIIRAEGEAESIRLRGQAIAENPEVLTLEYYEALRTINWAIFGAEDVQPVIPLPEATPPPAE